MLEKKINEHLRQQYEGIFLPQQVDLHIQNYVRENQSNYLIGKILPLVKSGAKILDIGSGYGSFVLSAIQKGFDCHGIELEQFEHNISKERITAENIDPSCFTLGSAHSLPYKDESFDVVTFWNVLEHVSNFKQALSEAKRVVKPGGMIYIIAPNYCSFRMEAHYRVPWFPLFPKPLARVYLKLIKRKTYFLDQCIFYVTMMGLKRALINLNLFVTIDVNEKILKGHIFQSLTVCRVINVCNLLGVSSLLRKCLFVLKTHPFVHSIDIIAVKK